MAIALSTENEKRVQEFLNTHPTYGFDRIDRNDTLYFSTTICTRCDGRGYISYYDHVSGGMCFKCHGTGKLERPHVIKVPTPEHAAELDRKREERAFKKAMDSYPERMKKAGFGTEGDEYVVYRVKGETFSKKEQLKELGCRFNRQLGWYSAKSLEEEGFKCQRFTSQQVLSVEPPLIEWKDVADVKNLYDDKKVDCGVWIGEIGEKIFRKMCLLRAYPISSRFGDSMSYYFEDENGNHFKWLTQKNVELNRWYNVEAIVKAHDEYAGIKYTAITRCKLGIAPTT